MTLKLGSFVLNALLLVTTAFAAGCGGSSPSGTETATGGGPSTGGNSGTATGGTTGATGGAGTGGSLGTGGSVGSGGSVGAGGVSATGGNSGGGGIAGSGVGGARAAGGHGGSLGAGGAAGAPGMCAKSMATFADITANHAVPAWLKDASVKYAIGMHFGPYAVGAHHNEWDSRHMYCDSGIRQWYIDHFGSNGQVGYKDLIAKMTLAKFDPTSWAALFKKAKAGLVFGSAQHHDRFAMWNSDHTKWCIAKTAGRDVIGEVAAAVRAQGIKFGVLDHALYGYSFQWCGSSADKTVDLYNPQYVDLYGDYAGWNPASANPYASSGPPNGGCDISGNGGICQAGQPNQGFMNEWLTRAKELTDKYQPDIHWFDWDGIGSTHATKLAFASYYYNAACGWGKEVAIAGKGGVFPGDDSTTTGGNVMIHDFEKSGRAPAAGSEPKTFWFVDEPIGSTWSYTDGMTYQSASSLISKIKDYKSRGGMMILNISPKGDGSIPQEQIDILTAIGNAL